MGVPEQLRRLDEDLATGRVDAETYRRRRDALLASRLPAPPPSRDDLDDSELDAAERELGFDTALDADRGRGGPPPAGPPRTATPPRGTPPPSVRAPFPPARGTAPPRAPGPPRIPGGRPPGPPRPADGAGPARTPPRDTAPPRAPGPTPGGATPVDTGAVRRPPPVPPRDVIAEPAAEPAPPPVSAPPEPAAAPEPTPTATDPETPDAEVSAGDLGIAASMAGATTTTTDENTPEPDDVPETGETAEDDPDAVRPHGIPVPAVAAEAPPLPETRAAAPALRPPPPPAEDDDAAETDERPLPADPFPPPFRWSSEDGDGEGASPDTTQVVRDAGGPAADRTQVVARGPAASEETQVVRQRAVPPRGPAARPPAAPPPPERTQFVPGAVPARAAGGGVARPEETAPPWADAAAARSEGLQGRELFARGPGPRAGVILGTSAVLLLVAIVLVASFLLV